MPEHSASLCRQRSDAAANRLVAYVGKGASIGSASWEVRIFNADVSRRKYALRLADGGRAAGVFRIERLRIVRDDTSPRRRTFWAPLLDKPASGRVSVAPRYR